MSNVTLMKTAEESVAESSLPLEHQLEVANLKLHVLRLQAEVTALNKVIMKKSFHMRRLRERLNKWTKKHKKVTQ